MSSIFGKQEMDPSKFQLLPQNSTSSSEGDGSSQTTPSSPREISTEYTTKSKPVVINLGNGRSKQGHRCTVECLNRYPIHHAARMGRVKDLKKLVEGHICTPKGVNSASSGNQSCCPLEADECHGRTPLHYAAFTGNVEKGLMCVQILLDSSAFHSDPAERPEKLRNYVNAVDYNHETAMHLAARNEAVNIVKLLILNRADLDIVSHDKKCVLQEVYMRTPLAMTDALNRSMSFVEFCRREIPMPKDGVGELDDGGRKLPPRCSGKSNRDELDFTHSYVNVCLNFYPLLGQCVSVGRGKHGALIPETRFLHRINRNRMEDDVRRIMLNNILVQAFLHFKWNKIKMFCFLAIAMHLVWLATYIGIVIDVFVTNCPYVVTQEAENGICEVKTVTHFASLFLLILSIVVAIKEFVQFLRLGSLYIRFENCGQCLLLAFIFLSIPNLYLNQETMIDPLHYQISAYGIFLAWTLLLMQLAKLPRFCIQFKIIRWKVHINLPDHGLYVEILTRVFKNFIIFITIFSSLLISFVFSFNILLPNSTGFINISNSALKVLTMMTGELNHDDIFHSEDEQLVYPISSHVMYAIFVMVATIILFNLLIGFTVSDIQGLQKDAEVNQISSKLEQIFLMECFLLSTPMQFMLGVFWKIFMRGKVQNGNNNHEDILGRIMVTRRTSKQTFMCYHTSIKSLPHKHRVEIRDWAARNSLSISDISGATRYNMFQSSFNRH